MRKREEGRVKVGGERKREEGRVKVGGEGERKKGEYFCCCLPILLI